jgi:hypothetical protein
VVVGIGDGPHLERHGYPQRAFAPPLRGGRAGDGSI